MAEEGRRTGRRAVAEMYDERAQEYRRHADTLRKAALLAFDDQPGMASEDQAG
jgi:two-component system chemotaxis response regulator CheB